MVLPRLTNACPKCEYVRQSTDTAPAWQCPQCGIAYAKASGESVRQTANVAAKMSNTYGRGRIWHRILSVSVLLSILLFVLAWWQKSSLPDAREILPDMQKQPLQQSTQQRDFVFGYRGEKYNVVPVAEYELWGLVVSHNNILGWTDIMHDENSVDIKDICVIWGSNIRSNDFRQASYSSGDFTCYARFPFGIHFAVNELSNNHLLSDDPLIRMAIRNTRIGDQIHLKGMLVNYSPVSKPGWWRNSSTVRSDGGNGACEVIFVEQYRVLKSGNALWYGLYDAAKWLILITVLAKLVSYYYLPLAHKHQV